MNQLSSQVYTVANTQLFCNQIFHGNSFRLIRSLPKILLHSLLMLSHIQKAFLLQANSKSSFLCCTKTLLTADNTYVLHYVGAQIFSCLQNVHPLLYMCNAHLP